MLSLSRVSTVTALVLVVVVVSGCGGGSHQDLENFMTEVKARPAGEIEPVPTFTPYKVFRYSAAAMRSPFEPPQVAVAADGTYGKSTLAPDDNRRKEFLEGFNFASLSMVGTLVKNQVVWALISDGQGGIHRVTTGNYIGKNHGKIVALNTAQIDVVEIVPDGKNGWVERPRTLAIKEN
jgi:type IV pilus assembly protein PilP